MQLCIPTYYEDPYNQKIYPTFNNILPAVSDYPYSLKAISTDVLKIYTASRVVYINGGY